MTQDPQIKWTPEAQDELRSKVRGIIAAEKLKQTQVATETGIPYGTFTAWLGGTYQGVTEDKAGLVAKWLDARAEKQRLSGVMPTAPRFQETATATRLLALMQYCQHAPDVGVIAGGAGIGKTSAAEEHQRRSPNVFIITAEPVMRSPRNFLGELSQILGLGEASATRQSRAVSQRLRGANALIIVDEAQHLSTATLNQARAIHDSARCGLVFIGNETVYSKMGDGRAEFAQLFSRVGMKVTQQRPKDEDVVTLVNAWGLQSDMKFAKAVARKPGALRGLTKCIRLAHVLAAANNETVNDNHLRAAWNEIGFDRIEVA